MTVSELIAELQKHDGALDVLTVRIVDPTIHGDLVDIESATRVELKNRGNYIAVLLE